MKQNKLKNCNNVVCFKGEKVDGDRLQAAAVFFILSHKDRRL